MGDGRSLEKIEEKLFVEVKPGYSTDTVLRYKTRGNELHGS